MAVALALAASFASGLVDFIAGVMSRRRSAPVVIGVSQAVAFAIAALVLVVAGEPVPSASSMLLAFLSGMALLLGVVAYYQGLATGAMGVVGPIAATAVLVPLAVGLILGDDPEPAQAFGIALAITGVVAAAHQPGAAGGGGPIAVGVGLAALAALILGAYYALIALAADDASLPWVIFLRALGSVTVVALLAYPYLVRVTRRPANRILADLDRRDAIALIAIGTLSVAATALFAAATTEGLLSIVAAINALFPVTTIVLARVILGERISAVQRAGAATALAGVAIIAATTGPLD